MNIETFKEENDKMKTQLHSLILNNYKLTVLLARVRTCIKTRPDRPVHISMRLLDLVPEIDLVLEKESKTK